MDDCWLIPLKAGVLIECGIGQIGDVLMVRDLLIMCSAGIGVTQIQHPPGFPFGQDQVLVGMRLFLVAIV